LHPLSLDLVVFQKENFNNHYNLSFVIQTEKIKPASSFALVCRRGNQANLIDLLGRLPFLKLSWRFATTPRKSDLLANCSASFSNPLINTVGS
jgi:hypothetical protein